MCLSLIACFCVLIKLHCLKYAEEMKITVLCIDLFVQHFTQYLPLSVYELESFLGHPSIYLFDCSAAGMIVNAFCKVYQSTLHIVVVDVLLKIVRLQYLA